jgi:uncharacterized protein (TIGR01777 family)
MKILIAGGTGLIGSALADSLNGDGHQVLILSRTPTQVNPPYQGVSWEEASLAAALAEVDALVNLAGESIAGASILQMRWTEKRKQGILSSRINAGQKLIRALQKVERKPAVFVQASAIGYYGNSGPGAADENTPAGEDFLAQVCLDWEGSTKEIEQAGIRRVVARFGLVLSQKGGLLPLLALPFRLFLGGRIGSGRQYMSWIHIADAVKAITYFLEHPARQGTFNLTAPEPVINRVFAQTLSTVLHRPAWFPVPAFALKLLLCEASTLALDGRQVLPARLLASGFKFQYPALSRALADLLG